MKLSPSCRTQLQISRELGRTQQDFRTLKMITLRKRQATDHTMSVDLKRFSQHSPERQREDVRAAEAAMRKTKLKSKEGVGWGVELISGNTQRYPREMSNVKPQF